MALREVDFLRQLVDMLNSKLAEIESQSDQEPESDQAGVNPMDRDDVFVPPLQAKIEMMKKMTDVPLKDETLKQSQEQGGPAPADSQLMGASMMKPAINAQSEASPLIQLLSMSDMFDDGPAEM